MERCFGRDKRGMGGGRKMVIGYWLLVIGYSTEIIAK